MRPALRIVNLGFLPHSADLALLFLRMAAGFSMLVLHGWGKFTGFPSLVQEFPDPLGITRTMSLLLAVFAELFCSALLAAGILTRFAAAVLTINMGVAFFIVHHGDMTTAGGGEPAALYLFAFVTILIAGGGRFSADGAGGPFALAGFGAIAGLLIGYPLSYYFQGSVYRDTVPMKNYLSGMKGVVQDPALNAMAIGVWVAVVLILAITGFLIGRAMSRRVVRQVERTIPSGPSSPP